MTIYIGLIILLILFIVISIILIRMIIKSRKNGPKNAVYDGGYSTYSGLKESASGKLFSGMERLSIDTVCINENNNTMNQRNVKLYNCNTGELYEFYVSARIYLGRNSALSGNYDFIYISNDKGISKIHCMIENSTEGLLLEDCNSSNHTYLNGKKIQEKVMLQTNDIIKIGSTKLRIMY